MLMMTRIYSGVETGLRVTLDELTPGYSDEELHMDSALLEMKLGNFVDNYLHLMILITMKKGLVNLVDWVLHSLVFYLVHRVPGDWTS